MKLTLHILRISFEFLCVTSEVVSAGSVKLHLKSIGKQNWLARRHTTDPSEQSEIWLGPVTLKYKYYHKIVPILLQYTLFSKETGSRETKLLKNVFRTNPNRPNMFRRACTSIFCSAAAAQKKMNYAAIAGSCRISCNPFAYQILRARSQSDMYLIYITFPTICLWRVTSISQHRKDPFPFGQPSELEFEAYKAM